jgi:hypothetical protein
MPNYIGIARPPQPLDNPGPGHYDISDRNKHYFMPPSPKKVKKVRYHSLTKSKEQDLQVSQSWKYLEPMLIEEHKIDRSNIKTNRITLERIKGAPTIPYNPGEEYDPSVLGPGAYDVKFELTERTPKVPKFTKGNKIHRKLPSV